MDVAAAEQLERVLVGTRSWLMLTHRHTHPTVDALGARAALEELGVPERAHDAALALMDVCWPQLDPDHAPEPPPEWWASPLGRAISQALARGDTLSRLRVMGPRAAGIEEAIAEARLRGASWRQIGEALGMSAQGAWRRWRR